MGQPTYPGAKSQVNVWRRICALMPRHRIYIEPCLGSGVIMGRKAPAEWEIGVDIDPEVIGSWKHRHWHRGGPIAVVGDVMQILSLVPAWADPKSIFLYIDAPYPLSVRRGRRYYRCEPAGADDDGALKRDAEWHKELLFALIPLECRVMVSCYWNPLYVQTLQDWQGWRAESFMAGTRGGVSQEWVWMNYGPDVELHDTRFVGRGFREREKINRKRKRWVSRFLAMPPAERQVIREAIGLADAQSPQRIAQS